MGDPRRRAGQPRRRAGLAIGGVAPAPLADTRLEPQRGLNEPQRGLNGKSGLERRGPNPPGQHGGRRRGRESIYGQQLREKQRAKRYYGVRERQFRRYVNAAARKREGTMGEHLLALLETRLDNVVYRLGFASTRAQARQFVSHGHVLVDGRRVTIPSYGLRPGQTVSIGSASPVTPLAAAATELTSAMPGWLQADFDRMEGRIVREPHRGEITAPVNEQLIVEFYSRR